MNTQEDLLEEIETRIKTTMIGSLAQFEKHFGYLWQNDHANRQKYEDLWEDTRNNILNNGNNQIRLALKSLGDFLYQKPFQNKYHYKFYFKDNKGDRRS